MQAIEMFGYAHATSQCRSDGRKQRWCEGVWVCAGRRARAMPVCGTAVGGYADPAGATVPRLLWPTQQIAASMSQNHFICLMLVTIKAYYLRVCLLRVLYARRRRSNL